MTILANTDPDGLAARSGIEWISLTPVACTVYGRSIEGGWAIVYGRLRGTAGPLIVWELRSPPAEGVPSRDDQCGAWYCWRSADHPWTKTALQA